MRILMAVPAPGLRGGIPRFAGLLADQIRGLGCEVDALPWGAPAHDSRFAVRVLWLVRNLRRFRRVLSRSRYDVLVLNTAHDWAAVTRDTFLLSRVRSLVPCRILQFHGGHSDWLRVPGRRGFKLLSRYIARASDGLLVLSTEEQRDWRAFQPSCGCLVVATPFEVTGALRPSAAEIFNRFNGQEVRLLFASRVMREKGVLDVIEAMPAVLKHRPCRLHVVGDGPALPEARECVARLGLTGNVCFLDYLSGESLWREYRQAAVFVLPTWWKEGFPAAIVEAMAAALPVVTTQIRGMADHLSEGVNALFVPAHSPSSVAQALLQLVGDPELQRRIGAANVEKANSFAPPLVAGAYLRAIGELRERRPRVAVRPASPRQGREDEPRSAGAAGPDGPL